MKTSDYLKAVAVDLALGLARAAVTALTGSLDAAARRKAAKAERERHERAAGYAEMSRRYQKASSEAGPPKTKSRYDD